MVTVMVTTSALVGRFEADARRFTARPVRAKGQPTWTLQQLASSLRQRCGGDAQALHDLVTARDWSVLNATITAGPGWGHFVVVPGVGRGYPSEECAAPVTGDRVSDEPWEAGEWLYLWEYRFGALHTFVSGAGRWNHVPTLPPQILASVTPRVVADIEVREWWLRGAS